SADDRQKLAAEDIESNGFQNRPVAAGKVDAIIEITAFEDRFLAWQRLTPSAYLLVGGDDHVLHIELSDRLALLDHELLPDYELLRRELEIIPGERNSSHDLLRQPGVFRQDRPRLFRIRVDHLQ